MRRLAAGLCLLLLACSAHAKTMIVVDETPTFSTPPSEFEAITQRSALLSILRSYPDAEYTIVPANIAKTEFCRTGLMVWNYGTARAYTEQFDAVIHANFNGNRTSAFSGYRPDSLCMNATAPTVPQLMLLSYSVYNASANAFNNSTSCSLGVSTMIDAGAGVGNHEGEGTTYPVGYPEGWFDTEYIARPVRGTVPAGGLRVLLSNAANSYFIVSEAGGPGQSLAPTANADSCGRSADPDTMLVWERLNNHRSGLSRVVACSPFVAFGTDSTQSVDLNDGQGVNWPVLMYAIAHLDSLSGGAVLGGSPPINMAFTVNGVGTRSARTFAGGIFSADTTILKTTCDSLRALGVPLTLLADPESLAVNMGDVATWKRAGRVRFSPWVRVGMDTTVAGLGNASYSRPVDVFGRYRNRVFYGDSTYHAVVGSDSSIVSLLMGAKASLRSTVGGSQWLSGFLAAPYDDWSPKNMTSAGLDSLVWAMRKAGFSAIQSNVQSRDSDPGYNRPSANAYPKVNGWVPRQEARPIALSPYTGEEFRFLGHNGVSPSGSTLYSLPSAAIIQSNIIWAGVFPERFRASNWFPPDGASTNTNVGVVVNLDNYLYGQKRAHIFALSAQSLGGGDTQHPGRPGWYVVKHMAHAITAINRAAGRTVLALTFAEDATP